MHVKYKITSIFGLRNMVEDIMVQKAKFHFDLGDLVILDIRFKENYDNGHIEGSIYLEVHNIKNNLNLLPKDKIIAVMCWGGGLSKAVTKMLLKKGFTNARNLKGGLVQWATDIDNELLDCIL